MESNSETNNPLSKRGNEATLDAEDSFVTSDVRKRQLSDAALVGDVPSLRNLLLEDPLILDRCILQKSAGSFTQSPLHIAVSSGHRSFVFEILRHKPELAEELDTLKGSSPLHLASAKGHLQIVKDLLAKNPNMCFARDQGGRNPLHVAAIRGHIDVLMELFHTKPLAAQEQLTNGDGTILHACVKFNQIEALKFLIDNTELLNWKDNNGNTVLHLAVAAKQLEIVEFLLQQKEMEKNAINQKGSTAMDALFERRKVENNRELWMTLKGAKALRAKDTQNKHSDWLKRQSKALMVVATLIATMNFQVGVNPPGGVPIDPGHSVLGSVLSMTSRVGLVSSLSVVLILISGLPCKLLFMITLMVTMWISVTATTMSYIICLEILSNETNFRANIFTIGIWSGLLLIIVLVHLFRIIIVRYVKKLVRCLKNCLTIRAVNDPSSVSV